ncbi:hypothetical protein POM88_012486 [Heracleum sosnowskyi]|uniref:Uncharacterized protein n=1 Tax=Heracleum sosnowskyi TaxID=360622 RepID=A0AAD8J0F6_9APIA|nr:hypothetical protein POM88_012486 [Heracleum sosnowskyi]
MEGEIVASSEIPVVKVVDEVVTNADPVKESEKKKDESDSSFDGEFIKVEKESLADQKPIVIERSSSNSSSSRELLEAQEKIKEIEVELVRLTGDLKDSELENTKLNEEVLLTKEKLEGSEKSYTELELNNKKLQQQISEAEERYTLQLSTLQEALQAEQMKQKELTGVKESFDNLHIELENAKKKMLEFEQELQLSAGEAQKFEELHKQSGSLAESETKKALEFEGLLEMAKASAKEVEDQMVALQEELKGLYTKIAENEKVEEALKVTTAELCTVQGELEMKELYSDLEAKLQVSDENFGKADSLLSQTLENSKELEQKLKSLEELHHESGYAATTATQKNVELEEVLQASNAAAEEAKSQLRELETRFIAAEQKNLELGQQQNLLELKCSDAEREVKEYLEKISELSALLKSVEEVNKELTEQKQGYENKIILVESELSSTSARNSELESELKSATDKCAEHEGKVKLTTQRGLELEDLIQSSHSKVEDAEKKVNQLELLLETEKYKIQELEGQISTLENKCMEAEETSKNHFNKASELETEIEALQSTLSSLDAVLQLATEKENELTESLKITTEEKLKLGDALKNSTEKLVENENVLDILRNELNLTQGRLESIECDLKASGMRETEVMEKLKFAEEQIEKHGSALEQATTRSLELESLHSTVTKDSELKLQEAIASFTSRDSEAKSLHDKVQALEDQVAIYKEQATKAAEKYASLEEEFNQIALKLASLESTNEELKKKVVEAEDKAAQSFSENELLVQTNTELKNKIYNELQGLLDSANAEKETLSQQLLAHVNTIAELNEAQTKAAELQLVTEARISEAETQLHETLQRFTLRDSEAKELNEKLTVLEEQINLYKEQAHEASTLVEAHKAELDQALTKLKALESKSAQFEKENEGLAEVNLKLTQELSAYESRLNDLQTKLSAASSEKVEAVEQLQSSHMVLEELKMQKNSDGEKLQSQISLLMEEKNLLTETHENAKKELQTVIQQLEGQLEDKKSHEDALKIEIDTLKAEMTEKYVPIDSLKKLEEQIAKAAAGTKEENAGAGDGVTVKSRDIGSLVSAPSKRKNKKKLEAISTQSSSADTQTQTSGDSSGISFNIILGVALVSVIIGVILGKRY